MQPGKGVRSLQVHVATQRLKVIFYSGEVRIYRVSTAKNGINNRDASHGTPLGWHSVCAKIGEGQPSGMVFKAREPTGRTVQPILDTLHSTEEDLITSRILWLEGLEEGINKGGNVDSKNRYIYIHGTQQEGLIGTPVSHGCVRMCNEDVIALFDLVEVGTRVLITAS